MRVPAKLQVLLHPPGGDGDGGWNLGLESPLPFDSPGAVAWVVSDRFELESARQWLLSKPAASWLDPGVRTLRQTAEAVLGQAPQAARPLTEVQRRRLVAELIEGAMRAGRLRHFGGAGEPRRVLEQVCGAFAEIGAHAPRDRQGRVQWAAPTDEPADREIAALYHGYQEALTESSLLDREGRLAAATGLLRDGQPGPLAGARAVLATGLRSLAPVERRLLVALARHAGRLVVTLPWPVGEPEPNLAELDPQMPSAKTAAPRRAVERLIQSLAAEFPEVSISLVGNNQVEGDQESRRVREWLFRDPRLAPAAGVESDSRYALIAARGAQEELQAVAGRVKRLLRGGASAEAILVATPRVGDLADRAEHAFAAAGVPLAVQRQRTLVEAPIVRVLLQLTALATSDWRRDALLSLVTSPALARFDKAGPRLPELRSAGFAGPRAATEWMLHELMLAGGRQAWLECLPAPGEASAVTENASPRRRRQQLAAEATHAGLGTLRQTLKPWRRKATPLEWFDRFRVALRKLGYHCSDSLLAGALDQSALPTLEASLADLRRLAAWRGQSAPALSVEEIDALLGDWRRRVAIDDPSGDEGRVRLVSAETARRMRPEYLFLVGMTEQAMPAPAPTPVVDKLRPTLDDHLSDQMLLFYELALAARQQVTFSYPALDAKGHEAAPSSYVAEVAQLLDLKPEPLADDPPATAAEFRCQAVEALNAGERQPLTAALALSSPLASGLRVSMMRSTGDGFGAAEGVFAKEAACAELAKTYDPQHQWSPTQLETYGQCPFKFLLRHVLGIEPLADFGLRVDYRRRGSLLHDAMAELHGRLGEAGDVLAAVRQLGDDAFLAEFHGAIESAKKATRPGSVEAALAEIEARQAGGWGGGYREQYLKYSGGDDGLEGALRPTLYETSFGEVRDDQPIEPPSRVEPFELTADGEKVLLAGRIDRIDLGESHGRKLFNVIDYKSAKQVRATAEDLRTGRQLQLFLYALAAEQHLLAGQEAMPWRLGYWEIQSGGFKPPKEDRRAIHAAERQDDGVAPTDEWRAFEETVRRRVVEIVRGVRRGEFPMFNTDEKCGARCDFKTTCRVGQTRSLEKQPPSPGDEAKEEGEAR